MDAANELSGAGRCSGSRNVISSKSLWVTSLDGRRGGDAEKADTITSSFVNGSNVSWAFRAWVLPGPGRKGAWRASYLLGLANLPDEGTCRRFWVSQEWLSTQWQALPRAPGGLDEPIS